MPSLGNHDPRPLIPPSIMYGTAWKEDRTRALTSQAIGTGFRAFDTANQRKHYVEEAVGAAIQDALSSGVVTREDILFKRSSHIQVVKTTAFLITSILTSAFRYANPY